jgi:hypothetical protein
MSKRLILILALAFVVGISCAAYAEVQNVKVSGDITMMGIARNDFNLRKGVAGDVRDDDESNVLSQIRVRIDADLTDNVMTTVRLLNERTWGQEGVTDTDVDLDLAYVTLKEFLYSPLSLTVGRQELRFGNGLIIGNSRNFTGNVVNNVPTDLTLRKAFDAIRATLNYDPLVVDLIAAQILKPSNVDNRDTDLLGINARYDIDKTTSAELYFFNKQNHDKQSAAGINDKADQVYTLGGLVSAEPIANLKASLEGAYQFGKYNVANQAMVSRDAFAVQARANYALPFAKTKKWSPAIGAQYTYLSGDKQADTDLQHAWDTMYYDQALNSITYAIIPFTNLQVINLMGSMKPADDITLTLNYGYYLRAQKDTAGLTSPYRDSLYGLYSNGLTPTGTATTTYTMVDEKYLGNALDLTATYAYTEDVQLGLTLGYFKPGSAFDERNRHTATQVLGTMKVTF